MSTGLRKNTRMGDLWTGQEKSPAIISRALFIISQNSLGLCSPGAKNLDSGLSDALLALGF